MGKFVVALFGMWACEFESENEKRLRLVHLEAGWFLVRVRMLSTTWGRANRRGYLFLLYFLRAGGVGKRQEHWDCV